METDINRLDALYIARHILSELNIQPSLDLFGPLPLDSQVQSAASSLESIEETWAYDAPLDGQSFGRKERGEIIKLWSVPNKSALVLQHLVALTQSTNVLEVGTSGGYSTLFLAAAASLSNGTVHTIEILPGKASLARDTFLQSGLSNINLIEGEAGEILTKWNDGPIDFVFLDADKENYANYLDLILPHLKVGGLIVADNINDYGHMMEDYLQQVTGTHLPQSRVNRQVRSYYLAALDNGLMITKKLDDV